MRSEVAISWRDLADIERDIVEAGKLMEDVPFDEFCENSLDCYDVMRRLEVISSGSQRVRSLLEDRHPEIRWDALAAARKIHDPSDPVHQMAWQNVMEGLSGLSRAIGDELGRIEDGGAL
ncbi:hypothetical protein [Terrarubrum flagellatum]|uniref:hypothetical protein n=1 Tax=Terrirubrum flagellatum TaxID=2895980 RepID=UPI00314549C8